MFHKLHRQITWLCTLITGMILIALSCTCLFFAESNLKRNNYTSFLKEVNTVVLQLQSKNLISYEWLYKMQENSHFQIRLYDNGNKLYYQSLRSENFTGDANREELIERIIQQADTLYDFDIFKNTQDSLPVHKEFSVKEDACTYYVSAGVIPKNNGILSFVILFPLSKQTSQILSLRFFIAIADVVAVILLAVFFWFFTWKLLLPLEENRKKQNQFVASASHELRTPLAVILSALEALKKTEFPKERQRFEKIIHEEGLRMQHLINDMLLLANSDSKHFHLQKAFCQPDSILLNVYEKYETIAKEKNIALKLSLPEELLPDCNCDFERMIQVLSILLDNALSYTPEGGCVTLSLSHNSSLGKFRFSVADTGPGISDKEKKLIFERFYRSDSSHTSKEHFGLGLCIANEIITAHKGKIWVQDAKKQGAVFYIEL